MSREAPAAVAEPQRSEEKKTQWSNVAKPQEKSGRRDGGRYALKGQP